MRIGKRDFDVKRHTYIMGILNVTPDSFSDGGCFSSVDSALFRAQEMIAEGADIIDLGGESTRPGHIQISQEEEIERVVPILERLKKEFDIPISIDTYKSQVAREAILAGADLINDIWGLLYDEQMAGVIHDGQVACCLMHNRDNGVYQNFLEDVKRDLSVCIQTARAAGIPENKIMLDPGVGFAKTREENLTVIQHLEEFWELGYPLLLGTSRKSVIGLTLDLPVTERLEGTLATTVVAVLKRCAFVRVHDVQANKRAILMTEAIREEG